MDEIERRIVLPPGAYPMESYIRKYRSSGPDEITAIYVLPDNPLPPGVSCTVSYDNNVRECTPEEVERMYRDDARHMSLQPPAGTRLWLPTGDIMPMMIDGGCAMITVNYRISTKRVKSVECNSIG